MNLQNKDKTKGIIATAVFHAVLIIALVFSCLYYSYPPKEKEIQTPKRDRVLFGGEYVMLGDAALPIEDNFAEESSQTEDISEQPTKEGNDMENSGEIGEDPSNMVAQGDESSMQTVKKSDNTGPSESELKEEAERIKRQKETAEKISKRVSFGNSAGANSGKAGAVSGNSTTDTATGAPGVSGLEGYTLASWGRPSSPVQGIVRIRVRVNSRGKVISASYAGGSGSAASDAGVRRSCEQASLQSQFSVPKSTTTEGVGIITWRFE